MMFRLAFSVAVAIFVSSTAFAQIPLTVDSELSNVTISIAGVSDSSSLSGTSEIILTPTVEPISTAQITEMNVILVDGFTLSIIGGLVSASTPPGDAAITMVTPGPAGTVSSANTFDQLMNESTASGIITVNDPFNLAGGSQTIDLSQNPPSMFDMNLVELEIVGDQLTVSAPFAVETTLDNGLVFTAEGIYVATGTIPTLTTISVVPNTLTRSRGVFFSGGLGDLEFSDNADLSMRRNPTGVVSITEFEVKGNSSIANPTEIEFTLEASVFARRTVNQTVSLFDYVAGTWEAIDVREATRFNDSVTSVMATGDLARFVDSNGDVEARITFQSPSARQQFSSNSDQTFWTITGQ